MNLIDILAGPSVAGVTGLVGGLVSKFFEYRDTKDKREFDLKMRGYDIKEAALEREHQIAVIDKNIQVAEKEGEIKIASGELDAFKTSLIAGSKVEGVLRFVRPIITFYLLIATSWLSVEVWSKVGGLDSMDQIALQSLFGELTTATIYLTVMCVGWWFGQRSTFGGKK